MTRFKRPKGLPVYQETEEEKKAQIKLAGGTHAVFKFERYESPDGEIVKYCVPGLDFDTAETLEAAGLIKQEDGGNTTAVYEPDNLRVRAWQMGLNETARLHGVPVLFPGVSEALSAHTTVQ